MAKPLSEKSRIIRAALKKHPNMGNTDLANLLNDAQDRLDDKLEFAATEVAQQKQALKKAAEKPAAAHEAEREASPVGETEQTTETAAPQTAEPSSNGTVKKKRGRPAGRKATAARVKPMTAPVPRQASAADLLDRVFELAEECGGIKQLRRIVERLAER